MFSDLSADDISRIKGILLSVRRERDQFGITESDEDRRQLNRIIDKLETDTMHTPFSDVSFLSLGELGIAIQHMVWRSDGRTEAKKLGNSTSPGALTVEDTKNNIRNVLKYVSLESEAGCRILINSLLIHVVSNLETAASGGVIVPESRTEDLVLRSAENSLGGVVDYMLVYGPKAARDKIFLSKSFAFGKPETYNLLRCTVYEANPDEFTVRTALPPAAMAAIIKAQRLQLKVFRGCVTTGRAWVFFVYKEENPGDKTVHWLPPIHLGHNEDPTAFLECVLGVLRDWVEHGQDTHLRFFNYTM